MVKVSSVTISTDLIVLVYPMLYTEFQDSWPLGSEEGDFLSFFTMYGTGSNIGHMTHNI